MPGSFASLGAIQATLELAGTTKFNSDLKTADKNFASLSKSLDATGKKISSFGKTLTKNITLPIVGAGVAAIKLASDFEVSSAKFSKAFEGAGESAANSVDVLNKQFGIASSQATSLLANTGDLLKGFGATSAEALNLSTEVQKVSVALAAYNGVPVKQASEAATKAILGETESMKSLGVAIRQSDVEARLAEKGQKDLTGQALLLAKAQATLELITGQSADAIASLSDNQGTLAFQTSALLGDLKDLGVEFGTILIPIVKDLVEQVKEGVAWFKDLDDTTKQNILKAAAMAAALGPVITAIGGTVQAVGALSKAIGFLAANPLVLALAGVAAVTVAVVALGEKKKRDEIAALTEEFGTLAEQTGVTKEGMEEFALSAGMVSDALQRNDYGATFESVNEQVTALAQNLGLTKDQVVAIGLQNDNLSSNFKEQLKTIDETLAIERERRAGLKAMREGQIEAASYIKESVKLQEEAARIATEEATKQAEITAELIAQNREKARQETIDARLKALSDYTAETAAAQTSYNLGLTNQKELLLANLAAAEKQAQALIDAGYDGADATTYGNQELQKMVATIDSLNSEIALVDANSQEAIQAAAQAATEAAAKVSSIEQEYLNKLAEQADNREYLLRQEKDAAINNAKEKGASTLAIEEYYDKKFEALAEERKAKEQEDRDAFIAAETAKYTAILKVGMSIGNMINQIQQQELTNAKAKTDMFDRLNGAEIDSLKEKAKTAEGLTEEESARLKELNKERKKLLEEQYKQQVEAFNTQKALNIANTIIAGAQAAIAAFQAFAFIPFIGPALGFAAAAAVAGLTITQVGLISAQKPPPPPKLASGGIVNNPGAGVNAIIGEAGPEAVLPLTDDTFQRLGDSIVESRQGTVDEDTNSGGLNSVTIVIEGMGKLTVPITQEALRNGQLLVPASSLI